jgi:hypothetical protein
MPRPPVPQHTGFGRGSVALLRSYLQKTFRLPQQRPGPTVPDIATVRERGLGDHGRHL